MKLLFSVGESCIEARSFGERYTEKETRRRKPNEEKKKEEEDEEDR